MDPTTVLTALGSVLILASVARAYRKCIKAPRTPSSSLVWASLGTVSLGAVVPLLFLWGSPLLGSVLWTVIAASAYALGDVYHHIWLSTASLADYADRTRYTRVVQSAPSDDEVSLEDVDRCSARADEFVRAVLERTGPPPLDVVAQVNTQKAG